MATKVRVPFRIEWEGSTKKNGLWAEIENLSVLLDIRKVEGSESFD